MGRFAVLPLQSGTAGKQRSALLLKLFVAARDFTYGELRTWRRLSSVFRLFWNARVSQERSGGVSRYSTVKNKRNTTERLELKKYCKYERRHTIHKEIK
jgi:ribosomal protein L33